MGKSITRPSLQAGSAPAFFERPQHLEILVEAYVDGMSRRRKYQPRLLLTSGLVREFLFEGKSYAALDNRHIAYNEVVALLRNLTGKRQHAAKTPPPVAPWSIDWRHPLGHKGQTDFRVLLCIARAGKPLDIDTIARRMPDAWPCMVSDAVKRLASGGIVSMTGSHIDFAPTVPKQYMALVKKIGSHLAAHDVRFGVSSATGKRVAAFNSATDGAARLFETDIRLRNLMALAKYGPLHVRDLRRVTGAGHLKLDPYDHAPFGRGELVRTWETANGLAAELNHAHPAARPLRRLLLTLETAYPLPPSVQSYPVPESPKRKRWDSRAFYHLFGNPIPTIVLLSIGVLGWTFEALCCELAVGYHRRNVKSAMRRMEEEGILTADRPRRPGMDVRKVTINPEFPAAHELNAVLRAHLAANSSFEKRVQTAMNRLKPKTRVHLRLRGLI